MARKMQTTRFRGASIHTNAAMNSRLIKRFCKVDDQSNALLEKAMERFGLSARAHARILKIARTIADLENCEKIGPPHVAEAIQYRTLDRRNVV
jgi:magnesium chelatase family protein